MAGTVYQKIMPEAERFSEEWTVGREAKLQGQLWNFEDNVSANDAKSIM